MVEPEGQMNTAQLLDELLSDRELIDLSVTTAPDFPCTPANGLRFAMSAFHEYSWPTGDYLEYMMVIDDHTGTHCDAPAHFIPDPETNLPNATEHGGKTIEEIPLEKLMGPAAIVDVRHLIDDAPRGEKTVLSQSPVIEVSEIHDWEREHGELQVGEILLFYTGWSDKYYQRYPEGFGFDRSHPAPNGATIEYIAERGIEHIGIDAVGIGLLQDDNEPHLASLGRGMVVTEKLTNLGKLPPRGAYFIFLPYKVEGATGGLGRALAII